MNQPAPCDNCGKPKGNNLCNFCPECCEHLITTKRQNPFALKSKLMSFGPIPIHNSMKLTKQERKHHDRAVELIHSFPPGRHRNETIPCRCGNTDEGCDDCHDGHVNVLQFIYDNFHPGAVCSVDKTATFFTPFMDALQVIWAGGITGRILEPCAGIGVIADAVRRFNGAGSPSTNDHVTCVEIVKDFVDIGKILVPEAEWIHGNIFDVLPRLGRFDCLAGNPPFGKIYSNTSEQFKDNAAFAVIAAALPHTKYGGTFILPAGYHGETTQSAHFAKGNPAVYQRFRRLHPQWQMVPTSFVPSNNWRGTNIKCEIIDLEPDTHYEPEEEPAPEPRQPAITTDAFALL